MKWCITTVAVVLLASSYSACDAFSVNRRHVFSVLGSAAASVVAADAAKAATAKTGQASPFTGDYDDPNHPGCLRQVKVVGAPLRGDGSRPANPIIEVVGYDGKSSDSKTCTDRPTREELWKVQGQVNRNNVEAIIDFSPKGGPENLKATFIDGGIVFPDGNKWTKVFGGTNDRRPKDMSTLKSS